MFDYDAPNSFIRNGIVPVNNTITNIYIFTGAAYIYVAIMFKNTIIDEAVNPDVPFYCPFGTHIAAIVCKIFRAGR